MTDEEYLKEDDFIENTYDELVDESEDSIFKRDKFLSKFNCIFLKQTYNRYINLYEKELSVYGFEVKFVN